MLSALRRRRARYIHQHDMGKPHSGRPVAALSFLLILSAVFLFTAMAASFLKNLSSRIAVSDACDAVTDQIHRVIEQVMEEGDYGADDFISLEKDAEGRVTAVRSNMAQINALSARILERVTQAADNRTMTVHIPLGNLTGVSLLMGRGPSVPIQIVELSSTRVEFGNRVISAGINQTKQQLSLYVIVDIDVLIPWGTESAQVRSELLIADTVVVGQVPETYLNLEAAKDE